MSQQKSSQMKQPSLVTQKKVQRSGSTHTLTQTAPTLQSTTLSTPATQVTPTNKSPSCAPQTSELAKI